MGASGRNRTSTTGTEDMVVEGGTGEDAREVSGQVDSGTPVVSSDRNKRTVTDRSPNLENEVRCQRRRLNEFDLGEAFAVLDEKMRRKMEEVTSKAPEELKGALKEALQAVAEAVNGVMSNISDGVKHERLERETLEDKMEDRFKKLEEEVKEQSVILDSLTEVRLKSRVKESVKEMEAKVMEAECAVKLLDLDIGKETGDKREIVRITIESVRAYVHEDNVKWVDRILKRTRIIIMGKRTVRQDRGSREAEFTVPTLFQCRDRRDAEELEGMLRDAGWYPTFHWPAEIMEMVGHVRNEVRNMGFSEKDHYIKVRPEKRDGHVQLKAEVKAKSGGRYQLKGVWACPPLLRVLWDSVPDLYRSKLAESS